MEIGAIIRRLRLLRGHKQSDLAEHLKKYHPKLYLVVKLVYYCAVRPAEIVRLRVSSVDLQRRVLRIPAQASKNKRTMEVAMPPDLVKAFEDADLGRYPASHYLFGRGLQPNAVPSKSETLARHHNERLAALGLPVGPYTLYSWKDTGAVRALEAGASLKDLQRQLRHHSLSMTEKYLRGLGVMASPKLAEDFPHL